MTNPRDIIIRPIITEKTMKLMDTDNKITFEVAKGTNKTQVRQAVETIFNVQVEKVNILNCRIDAGRTRPGQSAQKTRTYRKAIVKLPEGQDIKLFD